MSSKKVSHPRLFVSFQVLRTFWFSGHQILPCSTVRFTLITKNLFKVQSTFQTTELNSRFLWIWSNLNRIGWLPSREMRTLPTKFGMATLINRLTNLGQSLQTQRTTSLCLPSPWNDSNHNVGPSGHPNHSRKFEWCVKNPFRLFSNAGLRWALFPVQTCTEYLIAIFGFSSGISLQNEIWSRHQGRNKRLLVAIKAGTDKSGIKKHFTSSLTFFNLNKF